MPSTKFSTNLIDYINQNDDKPVLEFLQVPPFSTDNMDDSYNYDMDDNSDRDSDGFEESQESDQHQTQSTQQASQQPPMESNDTHLWGYLQPCTGGLTRIDFWKIHPRYTIGRNTELNQVVFPGFKISNQHCVISWDGMDSINSSILVEDKSSNGTFINGEKVGKGLTRILREGNEIAFGTCVPQMHNGGLEDYRFIYRHTAGGQTTEGLFAQYDLGTELGKGSFATVRKAVHKASGKWYAMKMIYPSKSVGQQESRNQNLIREISIMEKLDHHNICKLVEVFFQNDNSICLVLELVEGGDLLDHIMKTGGLSEIDARDITYQMCNALAYIHSRGVTHRDLKPENVLLTSHRPPIVKVADFGLAKVVDSATMLRTMCGTPSYLAPEVVNQEGDEGYDNRVDSWSVGVIVFAMISNASPFLENENQKSIKERILTRRIVWEPLKERHPSAEALNFVFGLLQANPEHRMSITQSLDHTWLQSHIPFHPPDFDEFHRMYDAERMNISHIGFGGGDLGMDPYEHGGSPTSALRRRKDVIAQADEGRVVLPEPSSEMVANVVRQGPATPKGQKKRARAELSVLPEDSLEYVYAEADARSAAAAAAAAANLNTNVQTTPVDEGSDSLEFSDTRRRSGRRTKAPRRA